MYKVIIVDDEVLVRKTIGESIDWSTIGYELVGDFENGKEAVEFLQSNTIDLILTDIYMPHMDGLALSKYVYDNSDQVQVVIFSGYDDFQYAKEAMQYRVSDYILKPFTPKELLEVLCKVKKHLDQEYMQSDHMQQLKNVYREYTKNKLVIISNKLSHLVKGVKDPLVLREELKEYEIEFDYKVYQVACIVMDTYGEGVAFAEVEEQQEIELMTFAIQNISDEIVRTHNCGLTYNEREGEVHIIFYSNKLRELQSKVRIICNEIRETVGRLMNISLSIFVGNEVADLKELSVSYETAVQLKSYKYGKGNQVYLEWAQNRNTESSLYEFETDLLRVINCVRGLENDSFQDIIKSIEYKLQLNLIDKTKIITYLTQIISQVSKVNMELQKLEREHVEETEEYIHRISNTHTMKEGFLVVREYLEKVISSLQKIYQSNSDKVATLAMNYLESNYQNSSLGLNDVCEYLNISVSHFSNIFKEATGTTCMDALGKIRMKEAKKLLEETYLKNYEVAERVGFSDPHYFSTAFKKAAGMTPKKYAQEKKRV